jgi:hypothetical protein
VRRDFWGCACCSSVSVTLIGSEPGVALGVVKACSNFGFYSGGQQVFDYGSDIEDVSV